MASNTEFKDKLIKLALPRLIIDAFGMEVDVDMLKSYGHYISDLDELDDMLKMDENGENNSIDEKLKIMAAVQEYLYKST